MGADELGEWPPGGQVERETERAAQGERRAEARELARPALPDRAQRPAQRDRRRDPERAQVGIGEQCRAERQHPIPGRGDPRWGGHPGHRTCQTQRE